MEPDQTTTNEIMEFLQEHMVTKQELKDELKHMVTKQELKEELQKLRLDFLDSMDEKISTLKGDLTVMMRGEDKKLAALIGLLKNKQVIDEQEARALLSLHPFPQI